MKPSFSSLPTQPQSSLLLRFYHSIGWTFSKVLRRNVWLEAKGQWQETQQPDLLASWLEFQEGGCYSRFPFHWWASHFHYEKELSSWIVARGFRWLTFHSEGWDLRFWSIRFALEWNKKRQSCSLWCHWLKLCITWCLFRPLCLRVFLFELLPIFQWYP